MRNKILIVAANLQERQKLEEILQEVAERGGELFFVEKREDALAILAKEHPQLVFLDASFLGDDVGEWEKKGARVVVMRERKEAIQHNEDCLLKPLKSHQVLDWCRIALAKESAPQLPPM